MGWLTVRQARERLSNAVSLDLIYDLLSSAELLGTKIGGRVLVDEDSLADLINKGRVEVMSAVMPDKTDKKSRRRTR